MDHLGFDLLTRHALGLDEVRAEAPTIRTFYNLRRRVRGHAQESGQNLYSDVFAHITDEQISQFAVKTNWQRMDSTQLLSNIALMSRLELVIATLQKGVGGLPPARQQQWTHEQETYLSKPAQNICYRLKAADATPHLQAVGQLLVKLLAQLEAHEAEAKLITVVARVIQEQYQVAGEGPITLKPVAEISGESLQSPRDPEATYRHKHEQGYKGYVTHLSETCDPENEVQLITSVQTAPNCVDDGQLLADTLADLAQRQVVIDQATVDGGYNGPTSEAACREHDVQLRPTTIRGGQTKEGIFGWEAYHWTLDEAREPVLVRCPPGQTVTVERGRIPQRYLARFESAVCAACPFFQNGCRVQPRRHRPPTLNVTLRSIQVAELRRGMSADNAAIRANAESMIHAFKHVFAGGKLPVRGLVRAHMMACGSALMVNLRRLHDYLHPDYPVEMAQKGDLTPVSLAIALFKRILSGAVAVLGRSLAAPTVESCYCG